MGFMTTWTLDHIKVVSSVDKLLLVSGRLNELVGDRMQSSDFLVLVDLDESKPLLHELIHDKVSILLTREQYKTINDLIKHDANRFNPNLAVLLDRKEVRKLTKKSAGIHIRNMRLAVEDWNNQLAATQQKEEVQ